MPAGPILPSRLRPATGVFLLASTILTIALPAWLAGQDYEPGYRPRAHAITGARVVTGTGQVIENGTVVVRDGRIAAVGPRDAVAVPADAQIIEGKDLVVYPGFVDAYTTAGASPGVERSATGAGRVMAVRETALAAMPEDDRNGLTPEYEVASSLRLPEPFLAARRKQGFTDLLAAPGGSIATGQSALASLSGEPRRVALVRSPVALHIKLTPPERPESLRSGDDPTSATFTRASGYPNSLMGTIAQLRQAMLDAEYHHARLDAHARAGGARPPLDPTLEALHQAREGKLAVWWEAETRDEIHRALDLAEEFGTRAVIVGGREAAQVVDRLKQRNVPVVLRIDLPDEPKVPTEEEYAKRKPEERDVPLRVLIDRAREWKERAGTAAALVKAGIPVALSTDRLKLDDLRDRLRKLVDNGLAPEALVAALTRDPARIVGAGELLGTIEAGKLGHLVVMDGPLESKESKVRYALIDGLRFETQKPDDKDDDSKDKDKDKEKKAKPDDDTDAPKEKAKEEEKTREPEKAAAGDRPMDPAAPVVKPTLFASELDTDRKPARATGGNVLVRNAVILTGTPAGAIPRGSILVRDGKIAALGPDVAAPADIQVIDAAGMVAMPGIIDTHSHLAIQGGVNETTLSMVPELRVADVVDSDDENVYRALAGGVTTSRLLHGSANTIGGQDVVIKHRWGDPAGKLILRDDRRPTGVKFALGENVTRRQDRFPSSRMGVEAVIERGFAEARAYARNRQQAEAPNAPPFRRDLRLDAFTALLDGKLKVHSHCYRSDENLMLLNLAERHGIRVQSLQHVLEGYKVAPEIAAHGASASTFSDWWAYKVEAYDATPYNAALLTEAGARVCIKSDSEELVRHLYMEAAKMVRYGGVTEAQALAMITANPAVELGLDHRIGTLEVGKDADIAIFNAHPFNSLARCELTLIDGEIRFERQPLDGKAQPLAGDHARMPAPTAEAQGVRLDVPRSPDALYALTNLTAHPVSRPAIPRATLVIRDGKIAALGGPETPIPAGATVLDAAGLDAWPGLIDAASLVGVSEIGSLRETQDFRDAGQFHPEIRASAAIHPESALIPVTRVNGVLAAHVNPVGGLISGTGATVQLAGWVPREMIVDDRTILHVNIPRFVVADPSRPRPADAPDPNRDRRKELDQLAERFRLAVDHARVVEAAGKKQVEPPVPDPRLEALAPFARGEKPVAFHADGRREILDALELARTLKLRAILTGGLEAWKLTSELKAAGIPVILTGTQRMPAHRFDPYDAPYANPARLHEAGIPFAIRSTVEGADPATSARNIAFEAAMAVAHGLPEEAAVESITLAPARILGVADRLGSLEAGKIANVVITAGPILQVTSPVKALFIGGQPVPLSSRHTELYDRYRQRLKEVRAGQAPLGLDRPRP